MTNDDLLEQLRAFGIEEQATETANEIAMDYASMAGPSDMTANLRELALDAALTGQVLRQFLQRRRRLLDTLKDHRRTMAKVGRGNRFDIKVVQRFERLLRIPNGKDGTP